MVCMSMVFVTRSGQKNVFQLSIKVRMAITAMTVFESGAITLKKIMNWLAPSTLADSMISLGMLPINCLARKMLYTVTRLGMMRAV
ncbi:hypothetical protein D3C81_1682410 [compost metagenome]